MNHIILCVKYTKSKYIKSKHNLPCEDFSINIFLTYFLDCHSFIDYLRVHFNSQLFLNLDNKFCYSSQFGWSHSFFELLGFSFINNILYFD